LTDDNLARVREFNEAFGIAMPERLPEVETVGDVKSLRAQGRGAERTASSLKEHAAVARHLGRPGMAMALITLQLIVEEAGELAVAWAEGDEVAVLDALADLSYVVDRAWLVTGMSSLKDRAQAIVHASNMSKLGPDGRPIISDAGRVVKPPGWEGPEPMLWALVQEAWPSVPFAGPFLEEPVPGDENNA